MVVTTATVASSGIPEPQRAHDSELSVGIHQPNYIPWLGYFYKMSRVQTFVFLDSVAYSKGSYTNRNLIKAPHGPAWLSIPVRTAGYTGQAIREIDCSQLEAWPRKHLGTLTSNYGRAPFFREVFSFLQPYYLAALDRPHRLADFNISIIRAIAAYLGLRTVYLRSSELPVYGQRSDLLIAICQSVGAKTYVAGTGAKSYQDDVVFEQAGIKPLYSAYQAKPYPQLFGSFAPNLSVVDALMNCGRDATRRLLCLERLTAVE